MSAGDVLGLKVFALLRVVSCIVIATHLPSSIAEQYGNCSDSVYW